MKKHLAKIAILFILASTPAAASASTNDVFHSIYEGFVKVNQWLAAGRPTGTMQRAAVGDISTTTPPTVTLTSSSPTPGYTIPKRITATFSKQVSGLGLDDITVVGGNPGNLGQLTGGAAYTFEVTPTGDNNTVTVGISANAVQDSYGNKNTGSNMLTFVHDATIPETVITAPSTTTAATFPKQFTVTFTKPVSGFSMEDIVIGGGALRDFSAISPSVYTFKVYPSATNILVTVAVPAHVAEDAAGNGNKATASFTLTHSGKITPPPPLPVIAAPVPGAPVNSCSYTPSGGVQKILNASTPEACKKECLATRGTTKGVCTFKQESSI